MGASALAAATCWRTHASYWNWEYNPNPVLSCMQHSLPQTVRRSPSTYPRYNMKQVARSRNGSGAVVFLFDPLVERLRDRLSPAR